MTFKCIEAKRAYNRKWYADNPEYRKRQAQLKAELKSKNREWVWNYKVSIGCQMCNETDPCCLDFHHINGDKDKNISDLVTHRWSLKKIKEEIKKCQVLCANCHRKAHYYGL